MRPDVCTGIKFVLAIPTALTGTRYMLNLASIREIEVGEDFGNDSSKDNCSDLQTRETRWQVLIDLVLAEIGSATERFGRVWCCRQFRTGSKLYIIVTDHIAAGNHVLLLNYSS